MSDELCVCGHTYLSHDVNNVAQPCQVPECWCDGYEDWTRIQLADLTKENADLRALVAQYVAGQRVNREHLTRVEEDLRNERQELTLVIQSRDDLRAQLETEKETVFKLGVALGVRDAAIDGLRAHIATIKENLGDARESLSLLRIQLKQQQHTTAEAQKAFIELWDSERSTNKKSWDYWAGRFSWLPRIK